MQTMHGSTGPNTLIITDILHDDILSMNIVSDKHEQASQSGWLGLHIPQRSMFQYTLRVILRG